MGEVVHDINRRKPRRKRWVVLPIKPEDPSSYGCQILQEKTTLEAANDKSLPNDARLIWYIDNGVECIDLTRCKKNISTL